MPNQPVRKDEPTPAPALSPRLERLFQQLDPKRGRLIFALDATMSRQPTWDLATHVQAQMFEAVGAVRLDIQLAYYRGLGECRASNWMSDARTLRSAMSEISCKGGKTQIRKILDHIRKEHAKQSVNAAVFVGDAVEETPADLYEAVCDVPVFVFQEGEDAMVREVFAHIADFSKGGFAAFNANSALTLAELLKAVAVYASGGVRALVDRNSEAARLLSRSKNPTSENCSTN